MSMTLLSENDQVLKQVRRLLGKEAIAMKKSDWDRIVEFLERSMSKKDFNTIVQMGVKIVPLTFEK